MSGPKLSQTVLYEVLVAEVESLKGTKREYDKVLKEINGHLNRLEVLYKEPIAVDTHDMRREHERIKSTLEKGLYIPKWLAISFLSLTITLVGSLFFNYKQHVKRGSIIESAKSYIAELNQEIEELKEKLSKTKR